jgi:hypothetical protein
MAVENVAWPTVHDLYDTANSHKPDSLTLYIVCLVNLSERTRDEAVSDRKFRRLTRLRGDAPAYEASLESLEVVKCLNRDPSIDPAIVDTSKCLS